MKTTLLSYTAIAFALIALATPASAETSYITGNSTLNFALESDIVVGYGSQEDLDNRTNGTNPFVTITGGANISGLLTAFNSSTLMMNGGNIDGGINLADTASMTMSGGTINNTLAAMSTSQVTMSGGSVAHTLFALENSTITFTGGDVGSLFASNGVIHYKGGLVNTNLYSTVNGHLHLYGTNLASVLTDPSASGGASRLYTLSGTLLDGTDINGKLLYLQNQSNARFTLHNVPTPASLLTLLIGVLPLGRHILCRRLKQKIDPSPIS
jgi:hypothetical protein